MSNKIYSWRRFPGHYRDFILELFSARDSEDSLAFLPRRPDIEPHSLVLNLRHPAYDWEHSEIEFYQGVIHNGNVPQKRGSAVFRRGRFSEGLDFKGNPMETLREFRGSLNEYFRAYDLLFGNRLQDFFANSNLDEEVMASFSELFDL